MGFMPLSVQPHLDHRDGIGLGGTSLFPPHGTFESIGGRAAVARLVDGLYDRIENDTFLRPAFNRDLTREREKLKLFFEAWFGGAPTYFNADWPPSIKAVHIPVSISQGMAMRWIVHFLDSFADAVKDQAILNPIKPKENVALAQALLRCGADTAARYKGRTALHCASKAGFVNIVKALIEHGADVNAINERGQTPLDEIVDAGKSIDREPVRRLLMDHGGRRSK